jgi:two-component system cell cycle response regulator DivK
LIFLVYVATPCHCADIPDITSDLFGYNHMAHGNSHKPAGFGKILIVEDNPSCFRFAADLLRYHGHTIYHSATGQDICDVIRQHQPDIILMDIQLPEVLGTELIRWIKAKDEIRLIPIVATTACAMRGDEERIRESGCDEYLAKPIDLHVLLAVVNRLLATRLTG